MTDTATPTSSMATATPTPTQTATATPSSAGEGDVAPFSVDEHAAALREAGSYTVEYRISAMPSSSLTGTEQVDLDTGARYASLDTTSPGQNVTFEFYRPPNSDTVYQHAREQTQEVSPEQAGFTNFSSPSPSGWGGFGDANFRRDGTAQTPLGTAERYVIDSADDLPSSVNDTFQSIENATVVALVDRDTGVIASLTYDVTAVQNGQELNFSFEYTVTELGSTTVEEPDWAP